MKISAIILAAGYGSRLSKPLNLKPKTLLKYKNKTIIYYLIKNFKFKNFIESQNFVNKVGDIAETEGHHPDIWFGWGYAKIKIFTHAIKGLHESDFVLAAKVDKII
mgnify:CR=1 FL=1